MHITDFNRKLLKFYFQSFLLGVPVRSAYLDLLLRTEQFSGDRGRI